MNDALRITGQVITMTVRILFMMAFAPLLILTGGFDDRR